MLADAVAARGTGSRLDSYVSYLTQHVQAPPPSTHMSLSLVPQVDMITMQRPHSDCLPESDVSFLTLLQALSVDNLLTAFALVLREQKVRGQTLNASTERPLT